MNWRFSISTDGGTAWTVVTPLNGSKLSIARDRDISAGHVFFRKKMTQAVLLDGAAYTLLLGIRNNPARRCERLLIKCEALCGAAREHWRGSFSAASCQWDQDACTVGIKARTVDRYSCLMEKEDERVNILDAEQSVLSFSDQGHIEYTGSISPFSAPSGAGWTFVDDFPWAGAGPSELVRVHARRRARTVCVSGSPVPPSGGGWTLLTDDCAVSGTAIYVKALSFAEASDIQIETFAPWFVLGTCSGGVAIPPPQGPTPYIRVLVLGCSDPDFPSLWLQLFRIPPTVYGSGGNGRRMIDALDHVLAEADCGIAGIRSDFFGWNPPGDAPGYATGINYVTGLANQVDGLCLLQKSDAMLPTASNPATIGEVSLKEILEMLRVSFRCLWDIDDDGYLRIEHWSYWTYGTGLDLTAWADVVELLEFEGLGDDIPALERAVWMEAKGRDFVGLDIKYDSPCATGQKREWSAGRFSTDMAYLLSGPDAGSKDGFALVATSYNGWAHEMIYAQGAITLAVVANAPLSWANLQDAFWRHDRYLPAATMNGAAQVFSTFLPTIKQAQASLPMCCSLLEFDAREKVTGLLAQRLGTLAVVDSLSHDLGTDRMTLTLVYPY